MEKQEPISKVIAKAKMEADVALSNIQRAYSLPSFLMDLIVSSVLSEIRDCVNKDYVLEESKNQNTSAVSSIDYAKKEVN